MIRFNVFLGMLFLSVSLFAQKKTPAVVQPLPVFTSTHDSLLKLMAVWVNDSDVFHRMEANGNFVKLLSRTLKQEQGFQFNLDTLKNVSCIYDPENTFRIITWMYLGYEGGYRHFGCIQFKENNRIIPFTDRTEFLSLPEDTLLTPQKWFGATYYQLVPSGKKKYLLIGFNKTEPFMNQKVLEVLDLTNPQQPVFGSPIFTTDSVQKVFKYRKVYAYSVMASMILRYEEKEKKILLDHLVPVEERFKGMYFNYIPDGSLDAFRMRKGKWIFSENVVFGK
jgi:hypothetical protein